MIMEKNVIVIRDPKSFCFNFDWPKDADENLKYQIEFVIKSNKSLAEYQIKKEIGQILLKYKRGNDIMDTKNSKTNEPHEFALNLSKRLYLKTYLFITRGKI